MAYRSEEPSSTARETHCSELSHPFFHLWLKLPCEVSRATPPFVGGETGSGSSSALSKIAPLVGDGHLQVSNPISSLVHNKPTPNKHVSQSGRVGGALCLEHFTLSFWDPQEENPTSRVHSLGNEGRGRALVPTHPREKTHSAPQSCWAPEGELKICPGMVQGTWPHHTVTPT